jgi:hypothetical protein
MRSLVSPALTGNPGDPDFLYEAPSSSRVCGFL